MKFIAILPILISTISVTATSITTPCDRFGLDYKDLCEITRDLINPLLEKAGECDNKCSDVKCKQECGKEVFESSPIGKRIKAIVLCDDQDDISKLAKCAELNNEQTEDLQTCFKSAEAAKDTKAGSACAKKLFESIPGSNTSKESEKKISSSIAMSSSSLFLAFSLAIISFSSLS